jgi:hypothetical protein
MRAQLVGCPVPRLPALGARFILIQTRTLMRSCKTKAEVALGSGGGGGERRYSYEQVHSQTQKPPSILY